MPPTRKSGSKTYAYFVLEEPEVPDDPGAVHTGRLPHARRKSEGGPELPSRPRVGLALLGHLGVEDVCWVARCHTLGEERGEARPVVVQASVVAQEEPTGDRGLA
jgi:hypothetical protein